MAQYSYTYSGANAAFIFAGVATLPTGIAVDIALDQHKALQKNKFAKYLIDAGELTVAEIAEEKPTSAGRAKAAQAGKGAELTLDEVRKALTDLEITFNEDETLEQLQAKLDQATG